MSGSITLRTNTLSYRGQGQLYRFLSYGKQLSLMYLFFMFKYKFRLVGIKEESIQETQTTGIDENLVTAIKYIFKVDKLLN
jgi:hypothetical protein